MRPLSHRTLTHAASLALLMLLASPSIASSGDRDPTYIQCTSTCLTESCTTPTPLPLSLRLTLWTCPQNCAYTCMHAVTTTLLTTTGRIHQFHGKWPFTRVLGIQEPASVIFSLLNLYFHQKGFKRLRRHIPRSHPTRVLSLLHSGSACIGWFWSAVFHTRDVAVTEKLDYFSAVGSITIGTVLAWHRIFGLHGRPRYNSHLVVAGFAAFYVCHVTYLSLWPFDYAYNMAAGVVVGALGNVGWLVWGVAVWRRRPYAGKIVGMVVGLLAAMALELLDFAPLWGVLDAHSLWHAATVPLVGVYYGFLVEDARWEPA
ncbi:Per1-like protein [Blyttiomyces helicus]|uniref:Post-GPI attachment to proteins factor 3 n=1 Tax=Blyttiomyces helicus TaxID=388810 RepID=A0A4P9WB42_9FUNG|nr:Per1-like protein [Blyttiomyces helicus]|eukprot:RKO89829.1 Per1-like protein [Blyttiomyces helicus]